MKYKNTNINRLIIPKIVTPLKSIILFSLLFCCVQSQKVISEEMTIQKSMSFKHLSKDDGLSQNNVLDIVQDKQGFLWFATYDGLNRYDGYTFKIYSHAKNISTSLSNNHIKTLYINNQNQLWVGTAKGLNLYNPLNETFTHITLDLNKATQSITAIHQDHQNRMWIGTTSGLYYQNKDTQSFTRYKNITFNNNNEEEHITSLLEDHKKRLWVGTVRNGLYRLNPAKKTSIRYVNTVNNYNSISSDNINNIFETKIDELWIATANGLNKYNEKSDTFEQYTNNISDKNSLSHNTVSRVYEDSRGNLWIGTDNGLNKYDRINNNFTTYFHDKFNKNSLSSNIIESIYEDKHGLLWFGTYVGDLNIFDPISHTFSGYQATNNTSTKSANKFTVAIYEDSFGVLWVSTKDGLSAYNRKESTYKFYEHNPLTPNSLKEGLINTIIEDKHHQLWIGVDFKGLSKFNRESDTFTHFDTVKYLFSIYEDEQEERILWLGSEQGLWKFNTDTETFKHYPLVDLKTTVITAILDGGNDHLWAADYLGGLIHFNKKDGTYTKYVHDENNNNSLISNSAMGLWANHKGELWLGTKEGLEHFNPNTKVFTHYNTTDGLPNNFIYSLLSDSQGNLWLSTNNGLSRFNIATKQFKNFDISDGLQSDEFNSTSSFKSKDGELFFGGLKGFNAFFPEQVSEHTSIPDVVITDFHLFNKKVPLQHTKKDSPLINVIEHTNSITLTYLDYIFSFDFAALHFADPLQNKYAYQLEGFDEEWVYTDATQRRATYTNLPSGEYLFKIKASNKDGIWNDTPKTVKVIILPAPWLTWWAYVIYVILIGSILSLIFYRRYKNIMFRLKSAEKIKESEERLSMSLWGSGDQFWDFNVITGVVHRINELNGFSRPELKKIKAIDDLAMSIHPEDKAHFIAQLTKNIEGQFDVFEIKYRLKNTKDQWIWVMNKGRIVSRDNHGKTTRMAGVLTNIHLLYETQSKLKQLNQDLEDKVAQRTEELQVSIDTLQETQQQLVQSEKMAALGDLVAGLAHEVNTPLGICVTIVSVQQDTLLSLKNSYSTGELTSEHIENYMQKSDEQLNVAQRNIERAATLIKSFKQIAVDQSNEVKTKINFKEYMQIIIDSNSPNLKRKKVSIHLNIPNSLVINTFPGVWAQIITNFIDNSIAHGFNSEDKPHEINIDVEAKDKLVMTYCDNGMGMSEEQISRVFEPFYTTKRGQGGTGLGMSICYNLVTQKLQGTIECPSNTSGGVIFNIICELDSIIEH